jgi:hypothetical protein
VRASPGPATTLRVHFLGLHTVSTFSRLKGRTMAVPDAPPPAKEEAFMKQSVKVCLVATFLAASLTSGVQAAPKDSGRGSLWTAWGSWVEGWVAWWSQATVHAPQGIWPDPHGRSPDPAPQGSLPDPTGRGTAARELSRSTRAKH